MNNIGSNLKEKDNCLNSYNDFIEKYNTIIDEIMLGGGKHKILKQHEKNRLTARERINYLIDEDSIFFELGRFAGYNMYQEYGGANCAGVISGIGKVSGHDVLIIANDATVKAGAYFEVTLKKTLRMQEIAYQNNIPIIYLVDSAGVFLPLQDQVFPDEGHFGRIFFNNARISAKGINQIACVMGPCVAGGAYLPVMCDKYIITEGANMFLAGPALVKAAIGQEIDAETLGGATTHSAISGIADYHEENDQKSLDRIKDILFNTNISDNNILLKNEAKQPLYNFIDFFKSVDITKMNNYDMLEIIARFVDDSKFSEYKKDYGQTLLCGNATVCGYKIGVVANQKKVVKSADGKIQLGGVVYNDSADKAARFIMNCNQDKIPIIFLHDVNGFMVGKDSEHTGIAKDGAKMVNAVSNSTVPKITILIGGSYGAGNYAMSGKAYNPSFIYAWPSASIAVMGGEQAAKTLYDIKISKMKDVSDSDKKIIYDKIKSKYLEQSDIKYAAARIWVDDIINPEDTRFAIKRSLDIVNKRDSIKKAHYGVLQV